MSKKKKFLKLNHRLRFYVCHCFYLMLNAKYRKKKNTLKY